jgi:hypothetical protein
MIRGLLVTDSGASGPRPTDDVDLIFDVPTRVAYYQLGEELRELGFQEAVADEDAPICRWIVDGVRTDIMPVDPSILGFTNVWYDGAEKWASVTTGPDGDFRHLDGPHFCATKLEAFASRGAGDLYHHDLEDFLAVVDGRVTLANEIERAPAELRNFIVAVVGDLFASERFLEALPGHLEGDDASQARLPLLIHRLRQIAGLGASTRKASLSGILPTSEVGTPRTVRPSFNYAPPALPSAPREEARGRVPLRSSNIATVEYDPASSSLTIEFHSGGRYRYAGVAPPVYDGLLRSYSHGRYFHQWIRNRYPSSRLR